VIDAPVEESSAVTAAGLSVCSASEAIAGPEDPRHERQAERQEQPDHGQADHRIDVGDLVEAPAEAADQIEHRIEVTDRLPGGRQHVERIEAAAKEGQWRHHEHRNEVQLLEMLRPYADNEAK